MSVLALDVGFAATGWVVFRDGGLVGHGCIETEKAKSKTVRVANDNAERAARLATELMKVCAEHGISYVVAELPSGGAQSASAMAKMAMASGVVSAVLAVLGLPVEWYSPTDVKKAVSGKGSASKDEIMAAIRRRFPNTRFPDAKGRFEHIADACGVYLAAQGGLLMRLANRRAA